MSIRTSLALAVTATALVASVAGHASAAAAPAPTAAAGAPASSWEHPAVTRPRVEVVAHRGFSHVAPENTMPAIRLGVRAKADWVEIDVQRSKDGRLVLFHDNTLVRTTDVEERFPGRDSYRVGDFTFRELRQLDAGTWKDAAYEGTRIPTLTEALAVLRFSRSKLLLELKNPASYAGIERQVLRRLNAFGYIKRGDNDRVQVQSFDTDSMKTFDRLAPDAEIGLLFGTAPADLGPWSWAEAINPQAANITQEFIEKVREAGLLTYTYTVNDAAEIERLAAAGVTGIITDRPDLARSIVRR